MPAKKASKSGTGAAVKKAKGGKGGKNKQAGTFLVG